MRTLQVKTDLRARLFEDVLALYFIHINRTYLYTNSLCRVGVA